MKSVEKRVLALNILGPTNQVHQQLEARKQKVGREKTARLKEMRRARRRGHQIGYVTLWSFQVELSRWRLLFRV